MATTTIKNPAGTTEARATGRRLTAAQRDQASRMIAGPIIGYMDHPWFTEPDAARRIIEDAVELPTPNTDWYHPGMETEWDANQPVPTSTLLNAAQERAIFLQFTYARFRAAQAQRQLKQGEFDEAAAAQMLSFHAEARRLRDRIVEFNLALVLAMAKHVAAARLDFSDLLSEGNLALLRAVDKFDVKRNFKFSTYACRAILKCFSRMSIKTARRNATFPASFDEAFDQPGSDGSHQHRDMSDFTRELRRVIESNAADLTELEQQVMKHRFPMEDDRSAKAPTLLEIGRLVGYSKERVRQVQNQALAKIREQLERRLGEGPFAE